MWHGPVSIEIGSALAAARQSRSRPWRLPRQPLPCMQGTALGAIFASLGFPEPGPTNQDVLNALEATNAKLDAGFAGLQSAVLKVQQSLDRVEGSLDYMITSLYTIKNAIDTVQSQISVSKLLASASCTSTPASCPRSCSLFAATRIVLADARAAAQDSDR
jgi:hypothetical protein